MERGGAAADNDTVFVHYFLTLKKSAPPHISKMPLK
jgi:hypothetical protein